jgi:hypothetical protein
MGKRTIMHLDHDIKTLLERRSELTRYDANSGGGRPTGMKLERKSFSEDVLTEKETTLNWKFALWEEERWRAVSQPWRLLKKQRGV